MNYIGNAVLLLFLFFMIKRFLPVKGVRNIHIEDLKKEINDLDKQFIDVRTTGEFNRYHITGFENIPLNVLLNKSNQLNSQKKKK